MSRILNVLLSLIIIITIVIIIHVSLSAIEKKDSKCTVSVERFTLILHFVRENLMKWSRIIINIRGYDLHERRNQFCLSNVAKCNLGKVKLVL